jgi:CheY-like chemotaxis protein
MEITCEYCNTRLKIPDEKIPSGKPVAINCPKCHNRLTLNTRESVDEESAVGGSGEEMLDRILLDDEDDESDSELDLYEEGLKLALVMDNDALHTEKIRNVIDGLGYRYVSAQNTREAIGKMRLHHFDLVILADHFDDVDLINSPIMDFLNSLPMSIRRRTFVGLVGDEFRTMDNTMAFAMSANQVINPKDLDKLPIILKRGISDNEKFYKVFMDTLAEIGKA